MHTKLSDTDLQGYVDKIRRIAKMDDIDARAEVDELIFRITEDIYQFVKFESNAEIQDLLDIEIDDDQTRLQDELNELGEDFNNLKKTFKASNYTEIYDTREGYEVQELKGKANFFLIRHSYVKQKIDSANDLWERCESLVSEINAWCSDAELKLSEMVIKNSENREIFNGSSVKSILRSIDTAISLLKKNNQLTDDISSIALNGKIRAARYRADKKMLDYEIAVNTGNEQKAKKILAEAKTLLSQDWRTYIKDVPIPELT